MAEMKHVGRYVQNQRKVAVAYRTVPQDSGYCLVVNILKTPNKHLLSLNYRGYLIKNPYSF